MNNLFLSKSSISSSHVESETSKVSFTDMQNMFIILIIYFNYSQLLLYKSSY